MVWMKSEVMTAADPLQGRKRSLAGPHHIEALKIRPVLPEIARDLGARQSHEYFVIVESIIIKQEINQKKNLQQKGKMA